MSKKSHTWRNRATNAKTGTPPVVTIPEKPQREKHPDPAWILPVRKTEDDEIIDLFLNIEPDYSETNAVLAGK